MATERSSVRQILKIGVIVLVAVVILGYSYYKMRDLFMGPVIKITSPINGSTVNDSFVIIEGKTKNISKITLNDRLISVDPEGKFNEQLVVPLGYTIISVEGIDRFGKKEKSILELVRISTTTATTTNNNNL